MKLYVNTVSRQRITSMHKHHLTETVLCPV